MNNFQIRSPNLPTIKIAGYSDTHLFSRIWKPSVIFGDNQYKFNTLIDNELAPKELVILTVSECTYLHM